MLILANASTLFFNALPVLALTGLWEDLLELVSFFFLLKIPVDFLIDFCFQKGSKMSPFWSSFSLFFRLKILIDFCIDFCLEKGSKMSPKVVKKTLKIDLGTLKVTFQKHQYY